MLLCFSMYSKQALEFCHYSIEIKTNKIGPQSKKTIENIRKDNKFFLPNQVLENNTISKRGQEERAKESSRKELGHQTVRSLKFVNFILHETSNFAKFSFGNLEFPGLKKGIKLYEEKCFELFGA